MVSFEEFKNIISRHFVEPTDPRLRRDQWELFKYAYYLLQQNNILNMFISKAKDAKGIVIDELRLDMEETVSGLYRVVTIEEYINSYGPWKETLLFPKDALLINAIVVVNDNYKSITRNYKVEHDKPVLILRNEYNTTMLTLLVPPKVDWEKERKARIAIIENVINAVEESLKDYGAVVKQITYSPRTLMYNRTLTLEAVLTNYKLKSICEINIGNKNFHKIYIETRQERLIPILRITMIPKRYLPLEKWKEIGAITRNAISECKL